MRSFLSLGAALLQLTSLARGIEFNPDDEASIKSATSTYAYGMMTYYKGNASGLPKEEIGTFPKPPYYWWVSGAAWGGLIEYTQLTGDTAYVDTLTQALVANYGPENDILLPWKKDQEGNDDQAFWAMAIMSALEYQFPDPENAPATYLEVVENAFNNMFGRWDTTSCGGGLKWQIYPENAYGYNYKNSISNGAVFALGARLARYTGNQTYADAATKIWDWTKAIGLISDSYEVFDGTDDKKNCTEKDHTQWSYNIGIYLHGASVMYNFTSGSSFWKTHTSGLLDHTSSFFSPYENSTDIMFEMACETGVTGRLCNVDQSTFKAYLSRFLAKTAIMAPFSKERVTNWLTKSAIAAAKSCSGGTDGVTCGSRWYTGGWDGEFGVGQQLSALEVTQALLTLEYDIVPGTAGQEDGKPEVSSSAAPVASSTQEPSSTSAVVEPPQVTETPTTSDTPTSTETPQASEAPIVTDSPEAIDGPQATETPDYDSPSTEDTPSTSTLAATSPSDNPQTPCNCIQEPCACASPSSSATSSDVDTTTLSTSPSPVTPTTPLSTQTPTLNATIPASPAASASGPEIFPGAGTKLRGTGLSMLVVVVCVLCLL